MQGHVRQRGNKWEFTIPIGKRPDGRRKRVTGGGFATCEEAEAAYIKKLHEMNMGILSENSKEMSKEYFTNWIEMKKSQVKPITYKGFLGYMKHHVEPVIGHIQLNKLTTQHIQMIIMNMQKTNSSQTIRHVHNMLKQGLERAVQLDLIPKNPAKLCLLPKMDKKLPNHWSIEELTTFLQYAKSSRWYLAFLLAAYTGARQGEILALRWENIDFKAGTVTIQNSVSIAEKGHTVSGPKTRSSIRRISLPPAVMNELRQWKDIIHVDPVNKLIDERAYNKPKDFIVHTYDGKFVNPRNFVKAWKKLLEESGLRTIRFHDLRHTHATFLIQSGINIKAISARLGHSTAKMTLDVYSHLTQPMEEGITATLQELALTGSQA